MKRTRRAKTIEQNIEYFCKRNNLKLTDKQKSNLKECFVSYSSKFSSNTKFYEYVKKFIKYDLKFWKQRLRRLTKINLKGVTKIKFLLVYGKNETLLRWETYKNLQALTNTFEYKKEKYGWTEDEFLNYNLSRSITLDNMIKKYGDEFGKKKYEDYVEKQKRSGCTLDYFIDKYGEIEGTLKYDNVCKMKSLNLSNFIRKYGEEEGKRKYRDYWDVRPTSYSKSSQELFWKIKTDNCYFAEYNKEFGLNSKNGYYFYDFVDTKLKKCIEFNGDYWHCNPKLYDSTHKTHYGYTAEDIWKKDENKINHIKSLGYDVMVIWESDYLNDTDNIIKKIGDFLNDKN